ncbi:Sec63 Brl domain-containing protein [Mycena pura]|uniref:Sec63 Brl domain-containing protein n=1 Tax=Mycena pura TaxID=153505 RepID=A0AAD6YSC4_9AGAR|nr:Sec63 Brl domain-containing protein [Mycena pura]
MAAVIRLAVIHAPSAPASTSTRPVPASASLAPPDGLAPAAYISTLEPAPQPPIVAYSSRRTPAIPPAVSGHPAASTINPMAALQPFLGTRSLGAAASNNTIQPRTRRPENSGHGHRPAPYDISQANRGRNSAITAHRPPAPARTPRRQALSTPRVPPSDTSKEGVFEINSSNERAPYGEPLHLPVTYYDSYANFCKKHDLKFVLCPLASRRVIDVIQEVTDRMRASPSEWRFEELAPYLTASSVAHEQLPLRLLYLHNRATPINGLYILRRAPPNPTLTVGQLLTSSRNVIFAKSGITIREGALTIALELCREASCFTSLDEAPLRRHNCLALYAHTLFAAELERLESSSSEPPCCTCREDSDFDDSASEMELDIDSDVENRPATRTALPSAAFPATASPGASIHALRGPSNQVTSMAAPAWATLSVSTPAALGSPPVPVDSSSPAQLPATCFWAQPFQPQPGSYTEVFGSHDMLEALCKVATHGTSVPALRLESSSIQGLAELLIEKHREAAVSGDYGRLYAVSRHFNIVDAEGKFVSTGVGIEKEVTFCAFQTFTSKRITWLVDRLDDTCALATTTSAQNSHWASPERVVGLRTFGSICTFLLLHGLAPAPLDPALFQYACYSDLRALDHAFVHEWHPIFAQRMVDMMKMEERGDLSGYNDLVSSYLEMQTAPLQLRCREFHEEICKRLISAALLGSPDAAAHDEIAAFSEAFNTPTANGPCVRILAAPPHISPACFQDHPIHNLGFPSIIRKFLAGTGVPCPVLWGTKPIPVSSRLDMTEVNSPTFRSKALCWAATGTPLLPSLDDDVQLILGELGDGISAFHMQEGTISFHTCSRETHIPLEYLINLCSQDYPASDENGQPTEPESLEKAIEHWLFTQVRLAGLLHSYAGVGIYQLCRAGTKEDVTANPVFVRSTTQKYRPSLNSAHTLDISRGAHSTWPKGLSFSGMSCAFTRQKQARNIGIHKCWAHNLASPHPEPPTERILWANSWGFASEGTGLNDAAPREGGRKCQARLEECDTRRQEGCPPRRRMSHIEYIVIAVFLHADIDLTCAANLGDRDSARHLCKTPVLLNLDVVKTVPPEIMMATSPRLPWEFVSRGVRSRTQSLHSPYLIHNPASAEQLLSVLSPKRENAGCSQNKVDGLNCLHRTCYRCLSELISQLKLDGFVLVLTWFLFNNLLDGKHFTLSFKDNNQASQHCILRAMFEICLKRGWAVPATLDLCKMVEKRMWGLMTPLRQCKSVPSDILRKAEGKQFPWYRYFNLAPSSSAAHYPSPLTNLCGAFKKHVLLKVQRLVDEYFPEQRRIEFATVSRTNSIGALMDAQPHTHSHTLLVRIDLSIIPEIRWDEKIHGAQTFLIMVDDVHGEIRYAEDEHNMILTVPMFEPVLPNYYISMTSDRWLHAESCLPISFKHLDLPEKFPPPTPLLDLQVLPLSALQNQEFEAIYSSSIQTFNKIQSQTICAEFALLGLWGNSVQSYAVCIEPYEEMVDMCVKEWRVKFWQVQGKKEIVSLTGETSVDLRLRCNHLHTDPGGLLTADEVQLVGGEVGPAYEVVNLPHPIRLRADG